MPAIRCVEGEPEEVKFVWFTHCILLLVLPGETLVRNYKAMHRTIENIKGQLGVVLGGISGCECTLRTHTSSTRGAA